MVLLSLKTTSPMIDDGADRPGHAVKRLVAQAVHIMYYEAGHMMYVHPGSMGKFSGHMNLCTFISSAVP